MPAANWQQGGSFPQPLALLTEEPDAGTLVQLPCINQTWVLALMGCLDQLRNPSTWDPTSTPSQIDDMLGRVTRLQEMMWGGMDVPCCNVTMQLTDGCLLQWSVDGGSTWTTVSGWEANIGGCVASSPPPPPPVIGGATAAQQACNIAGYLAEIVIRRAMESAIQAIQNDFQILQWGMQIIGAIPGAYVVYWIIDALNGFWHAIKDGTLSHFQDAILDDMLWSQMTCAIYAAIATDGGVTPANFAAVRAAICGVSYTHADVILACCDFITAIGATGLMKLQAHGAVAAYDCSGCGTGAISGPTHLPALKESATTVLTILAHTAAQTAHILFQVPFNSPPVLISNAADPLLLPSVSDVTTDGFDLTVASAFDVTADTASEVFWQAEVPGEY
jgi:hypothetical protein